MLNGDQMDRGSQEGRRNVHESFWFYCTFSIILRNSGKKRDSTVSSAAETQLNPTRMVKWV